MKGILILWCLFIYIFLVFPTYFCTVCFLLQHYQEVNLIFKDPILGKHYRCILKYHFLCNRGFFFLDSPFFILCIFISVQATPKLILMNFGLLLEWTVHKMQTWYMHWMQASDIGYVPCHAKQIRFIFSTNLKMHRTRTLHKIRYFF